MSITTLRNRLLGKDYKLQKPASPPELRRMLKAKIAKKLPTLLQNTELSSSSLAESIRTKGPLMEEKRPSETKTLTVWPPPGRHMTLEDTWLGRTVDDFELVAVVPSRIARHAYPFDENKRTELLADIHEALGTYENHLRAVMAIHPEPFRITKVVGGFEGTIVLVGGPMQFSSYDAIPVYIKRSIDEKFTLTFAYASKSHACRRRFVGEWKGIFWKGSSEQLQNYHWRIQKALDEVAEKHTFTEITLTSDSVLSMVDGLCIFHAQTKSNHYAAAAAIIVHGEDALQKFMLTSGEEYDLSKELNGGTKQMRLLDYWWAGHSEGPYGRYVNLVVESNNYIYSVALNEDGLFLKYVQSKRVEGINGAGAPISGLKIPDEAEWIFTPMVEYEKQVTSAERANPSVQIDATIVFDGPRVRVNKLHDVEKSPLFRLRNGLSELSKLMWMENYTLVEHRLARIMKSGGMLPLSSEVPEMPPQEELDEDIKDRHHHLTSAFEHYFHPGNGFASMSDADVCYRLGISSGELALFKRYSRYAKSFAGESSAYTELDGWLRQIVERRLGKAAKKWAENINSKTVPLSVSELFIVEENQL